MYTLKINVGGSVLECQSGDMKDICKFSSVWGMLPKVCDECQQPAVALDFRKTQDGYEYCLLSCKNCNAQLTIHQNKQLDYYIKWDKSIGGRERMKKWVPQQQSQGQGQSMAQNVQQQFSGQQVPQGNGPFDDGSIPF